MNKAEIKVLKRELQETNDNYIAEGVKRRNAEAQVERLKTALVNIGEQAREGSFTDHGECPATFACSAIIAELINLGMPPEGVTPVKPAPAPCTKLEFCSLPEGHEGSCDDVPF